MLFLTLPVARHKLCNRRGVSTVRYARAGCSRASTYWPKSDPTNGGAVSTPLSSKVPSLASPEIEQKERVCEEQTLRRTQAGHAWPELQNQ